MDTLERGTATPGTPSGWLNRVLQARGENGVFSAVQMGSSLPLSLAGDAPALSMNGIQSFGLAGYDDIKVKAANAFAALYKGVKHPVADQVRDTVAALGKVGSIAPTPAAAAKAYPQGSGLAGALMDVARLVKANLGMTIATLDVGGWDMHTNEGRVDGGDMLNHLTELDAALSAFAADLGDAFKNVTVVLISEFGRTIRENGSVGTDHGHGQAHARARRRDQGRHGLRRVARPRRTRRSSRNGSLAARTDYRDVLGEVLAKRARVGSFTKIFPDYKPKPVGLANAR